MSTISGPGGVSGPQPFHDGSSGGVPSDVPTTSPETDAPISRTPTSIRPMVPTGTGEVPLEQQRQELAASMRRHPDWASLPQEVQEAIDRVLLTRGSAMLASELGKLIDQPGFATRLTPLARAAMVDLFRRNPEGAVAINRGAAELTAFFETEGFERLAPEDQERVLDLLAFTPEAGRSIGDLVDTPVFRGLDQASKEGIFDQLDQANSGTVGRVIGEQAQVLGDMQRTAEGKADEVLKALRSLEGFERLGPIGPLANAIGQEGLKRRITELLTGPDANLVYRALEAKGAGRVHDLIEQLIESPRHSETRGRLISILSKLDPDNSAKFISNLAHGIGKELQKERIFDAIAAGITISGSGGVTMPGANAMTAMATQPTGAQPTGSVMGAGVGMSGGVIGVGVRGLRVGPVAVEELKLGFNPNPLREALARQRDKDYRNLLTEVLDSFTKQHELTSGSGRWSNGQKREYFEAIRRLPGGGGASDLTAIVRQPEPMSSGATATTYPRTTYPNTGYPNTGYPNTGYPNTGYPNTGYPNTGYPNTGYPNTGNPNTGNGTNPTGGGY